MTDPSIIYAHTDKEKEWETLVDHSNLTLSFYHTLEKENGLGDAIDRIVSALIFDDMKLSMDAQYLIKHLFKQAIYLHDIGKVNPGFQRKRLTNKEVFFEEFHEGMDSHHALLSSLLFIDLYLPEVKEHENEDEQYFLHHVLYTFAYCISRHHTYLQDVEKYKFEKKLICLHKKVKRQPHYLYYYLFKERLLQLDLTKVFNDNTWSNNEHNEIPFYILTKLLYSTMVACDFYATYTYMEGHTAKLHTLTPHDIQEFMKVYQDTDIYKGIQKYKENPHYFDDVPINRLRSQMFLEAEDHLLKQVDTHLFYLEAPTGAGKTNISINLSLHLLNQGYNKLLYIFPFNRLIEQTKETFDKIFDHDFQKQHRISVINSVTPVTRLNEQKGEAPYKYREELLQRQMLHYPVTLTSHVNFFRYLFGTGRESNLALVHLCNSVIVIDEVQSYRNEIWVEIIRLLSEFSKFLNIKIIIMSATLPKLDRLLNEPIKQVELIPNKKKYYQDDLFKNRVKLHFDLLKQSMTLEKLANEVRNIWDSFGKNRLFIEFISKKSARAFYQLLSEQYPNQPILMLTGDDHAQYVKTVLSQLSECNDKGQFKIKDVVLITTQVVEAGVDIDMDIGLKDISLLDSEEQFLGRINRSCKRKNGHAFFFNLDQASTVYKKDWRLERNLLSEEYQKYLQNKDFDTFYQYCFQRLVKQKQQYNDHNLTDFLDNVLLLNFKAVEEHMELITERNISLFVNYELELEDGSLIQGGDIWNEYKSLLEDKEMDYAERRIRLINLQEQMNYFVFQYVDYNHPGTPKRCDDQIGNLFYIENGEEFMREEPMTGMKQFDVERYIEESEGIFL